MKVKRKFVIYGLLNLPTLRGGKTLPTGWGGIGNPRKKFEKVGATSTNKTNLPPGAMGKKEVTAFWRG